MTDRSDLYIVAERVAKDKHPGYDKYTALEIGLYFFRVEMERFGQLPEVVSFESKLLFFPEYCTVPLQELSNASPLPKIRDRVTVISTGRRGIVVDSMMTLSGQPAFLARKGYWNISMDDGSVEKHYGDNLLIHDFSDF